MYLPVGTSTATNKAIVIGPLKYRCNGSIPIVSSDEPKARDPISFAGDMFQVFIFVIVIVLIIFFSHIRLTQGCIVDTIVLICSRWFMEV